MECTSVTNSTGDTTFFDGEGFLAARLLVMGDVRIFQRFIGRDDDGEPCFETVRTDGAA